MKRYIVELGMGVDLHGGDVTKATQRAMRDAISHSCLCGLNEVIKPQKMLIKVNVACPKPQEVDTDKLRNILPFGELIFESITEGGMTTTGLHIDALGTGDQIVISLVSLTVYVE